MTEQNEEAVEAPKEEGESSSAKPKQVLMTDTELKAMQHEVMDYKDKYLRQLADSDNARKRLQKEREELVRFSTESLIIDFLKPLDNLENALKYAQDMSDEVKNWAFGFQMILAQFKDVLASNGVVAVPALGMPFDPHVHEAVEMVETTESLPGIVVEECFRGYKMGDRMIRPARVKVAKSSEPSEINS